MTKILIDEALRYADELDRTGATDEPHGCAAELRRLHAENQALRKALSDAALDKKADNARELGLSYEQPAQQEPVAWMWKDGTVTSDPDRADGTWTKLYTIPPAPAKPWVGLTHDERKKLADVIRFNNIWYLEDMLRAAEEMLERKNT